MELFITLLLSSCYCLLLATKILSGTLFSNTPIPLTGSRQMNMDFIGSKASGPFCLNNAPTNFCVHSYLLLLLIDFPVTTPPLVTCFATSPKFLTPSKRSTNLFVPMRVEAIAGPDAALPPY